jgi:hypothetical protein
MNTTDKTSEQTIESGRSSTVDALLNTPYAGLPMRRGHWSRLGQRWRRNLRDDDDDPSSPAPAARPPRLPVLDGAAAVAA